MEPRAEAANFWVEESAVEAGNSSVGELAVEVLEAVASSSAVG